ncbi:MAG TPA: ATPase, partial [Treponema sp.]|nr:ATPase [Treponema sp.]
MSEKETLVERNGYLAWLIRWKDRRMIKVVSGVRRSGKSTLFTLFRS